MGVPDLVEQHHAIRTPPDALGQLAAAQLRLRGR